MDILVLHRLAMELDAALRGARIDQVYALPRSDVVMVCRRRSQPRLWFSTEAEQPHLYERPGPHASPARPPGFAMAARNLLNGRRIAAITPVAGERIVELHTGGDEPVRVIFEVIPRRATALVLDHEQRVRAAWQPRRGRPDVGDAYVAPEADARPALEAVAADTWSELAGAPDGGALVRGLVRSIAGMSPLTAREIAAGVDRGTTLEEAAHQQLERAHGEATAARIYSPVALERLATLPHPPGPRSFLLAPFRLRHLEDAPEPPFVTEFDTLAAAAATYFPLRAAILSLAKARQGMRAAVGAAVDRLARTLDAVAGDAEGAGNADQHRRWGDLLLASPHAPRDGDVAHVPDVFADGEPVDVPIDPGVSLIDNAQRYYRRAKRAERSAERTAARRRSLERRLVELDRIRAAAAEAESAAACGRLARAASKAGVRIDPAGWTLPEAAIDTADADLTPTDAGERTQPADADRALAASRRKHGAGIDVFAAADGREILVGRSAEANERLTHKLARPHDFWLHAEGPGSHVVIRNPERADEPPADALGKAASLAAYFSSSRGATRVNVRWTQVRYVRKPRKGPKGQVVLRQANTTLAEPVAPERLFAAPASD